jgi:hypothetical protein
LVENKEVLIQILHNNFKKYENDKKSEKFLIFSPPIVNPLVNLENTRHSERYESALNQLLFRSEQP